MHASSGWLLGLFTALLLPGWVYGIRMMELCHWSRLQARAALVFLPHFRPQQSTRIDVDLDFVLTQARALDRYGYLKPPLVKSTALAPFRPTTRTVQNAAVNEFSRQPDGSWKIAGSAWWKRRPADLILITAEAAGKEPVIAGIAESGPHMPAPQYRMDLMHVGRRAPDHTMHLGWEGALPPGAFSAISTDELLMIKVWLFDRTTLRAHPLEGEWQLDPVTQTLTSSARVS